MALLDELLAWSRSLPVWQQDALRRLFEVEGNLSEDGIQEVMRLLKAAHGVEISESLTPVPLAEQHIQVGATGAAVRILALNDLNSVNGFPDGRSLEFSAEGMTIVFGENGAGKSGYARVLKNACRARQTEAVRPNAFENNQGRTPTARVVLTADEMPRYFEWMQGGVSDPDLSSVAVYDAKCAASYIETEGAPAFQPFGLAQLLSFAKMCGELERRINAEIQNLPTDARPFQGLLGDTPVGAMIRVLGAETDIAVARRLGVLSEADIGRSLELTAALAELNPEPKALVLDRFATRLENLVVVASTAHSYVTVRAVERLQALVQVQVETNAAHRSAQQILQGQDLLPGTGSDVWRAMFNAAQQYSIQEAYPGSEHIHAGEGAKCVLCQTELATDAKERLASFTSFIASSTLSAATTASSNLDAALQKIRSADFGLGVDETLMAEIAEYAPIVHQRFPAWVASWALRREWMLSSAASNTWEACPELLEGSTLDAAITEAATALRTRAHTLRATANPQQKALLQAELSALRAREALAPLLPALEQYVNNSKKIEALKNCRTSLGTAPVSRQLTTFADTYITQALLDAMKDELDKLGYHRTVRHRVPRRTERGVTMVRVALEGSNSRTEEVLSEGEQRATALAFFLAEMRLTASRSTLVFDDPVTSMDHRYRRAVARRLAEISKERQVIVFTHDAIFLMALHHACDEETRATYKTVEWDTAPGNVIDGLSWDNMKSGQRVGSMKQELAEIRRGWGEYPSEESKRKMTAAYTNLRGTIERIIREDLVNGVVQPYTDEVNVEKFSAVVGMDPQEWSSLLSVYDHACEVTRAHDTTSEQQVAGPDPDRLGADISILELVIASAKTRRARASEAQAERGKQRRGVPV